MREAVYNLAIPNARTNRVNRNFPRAHVIRILSQLSCCLLGWAIACGAADWNSPEQQLARKIVAVTGPGAVALTVQNRSSLGKRDQEIIQNGLRSAMEGLGIRFVNTDQAAVSVAIFLSENSASYVWTAEIRQGPAEPAVVLVSAARAAGVPASRESVPLNLRKIPLFAQEGRILDVAVLEEGATPTLIAVLEPEKVTIYRWQSGKWQQEQTLGITHARPWPRDLRGRLRPAKNRLWDISLPGVACSTAGMPLALNCRESDDPWLLVPAALMGGSFTAISGTAKTGATIPAMAAFYAPTRNFFTGALSSPIGKSTTAPKFYSAAFLPRDKYLLWLFAATDGRLHMMDGLSDQTARVAWGSDLASVRTGCGAGWQVLASSPGDGKADSVRAYEFPDREPVAVSAAVDVSGPITSLWTEETGETAVAVIKNSETGNYEAFRLAVVCSQ